MYYEDPFDPTQPNDVDDYEIDKIRNNEKILNSLSHDRGLNTIVRKVTLENGRTKNKRIRVYTSGGAGTRIRDAETGEFYPNMVGSKDEDLFFKVALSTGECNSANGSSILFFSSPQHCMNHIHCTEEQGTIAKWEAKRDARLAEIKKEKQAKSQTVIVK